MSTVCKDQRLLIIPASLFQYFSAEVSRPFSISKSSCWPSFSTASFCRSWRTSSLCSISHVQIKPASQLLQQRWGCWTLPVCCDLSLFSGLICGCDRRLAPWLFISCRRGPPINLQNHPHDANALFTACPWHSIWPRRRGENENRPDRSFQRWKCHNYTVICKWTPIFFSGCSGGSVHGWPWAFPLEVEILIWITLATCMNNVWLFI